LPLGHGAIERIWREHDLIHPRRRKYQKKQDLARWKQTWALFQPISADTKDLDDIPHYWPQMKARGLPAIQYTAREVRSGLQFLAYASRRSAQASELFAERIQRHLARCGVTLRDVTWQTDNGGEFVGELQPDGSRSHFPHAVTYFGSQHERIPPAAHTFQSDVETVHRLIEDEFFDLETFQSRADFLAKVSLYQLYFNLARPNSHKGGLTPWQIIQQLAPRLPLNLCLLPPTLLDYRLDAMPRDHAPTPQGGYDLPRLPYRRLPTKRAPPSDVACRRPAPAGSRYNGTPPGRGGGANFALRSSPPRVIPVKWIGNHGVNYSGNLEIIFANAGDS
jgi:hypothetical protein